MCKSILSQITNFVTKFKLLWGSIIHLDIFYHKFANRQLIIQPAVERFLNHIGEGSYKKTGKFGNRGLISLLMWGRNLSYIGEGVFLDSIKFPHIFIVHITWMFLELQKSNSPFNMDFHLWLYGEEHIMHKNIRQLCTIIT